MMTCLATGDAQPHFRGSAAGDRDRAQIIGDHIEGATSALHTHHVLEDDNVWPLLLDRCGESVAPLVEMMEGHHHQIARLIPQVDEALSVWRDSPTVESRQGLIDILDRLIP